MAYTNNLLFNNVFLRSLSPTDEELATSYYLAHRSAKDWFQNADLSSPGGMADTWIRPVLNQQSLDLVPAGQDDENAWYIVAPWDREKPLALCYVTPYKTNLDGYTPENTLPKGRHWMILAVNLARRLSGLNLRWVLLTNGEQWRLLDASCLRRYEAFLEIDLYHLLAGEDDPMAAYLFYRLLRLEDSLERDEKNGRNKLDTLLDQSTKATEATERYLKTIVSEHLNAPGGGEGIMAQLCMGLVHAIDPERTKSYTEQERDAVYRDATYLLYRLLFILYAEARNLLPMDRPDYRAVSLHSMLDEAVELRDAPLKSGVRPTSLWSQLSSLFNAIQYSDEYLGIPAYNGGLFDNKDKPYLRDYTIENKYLADALCELAFLPDPKGERSPERIDYCDLSVRHLGSLYEGMIEYKLFIADRQLYARRDKTGRVQYLNATDSERKITDEIVEPGKVYFAQSPHERKATGTHYTVEELVERLVRQTVVRILEKRWRAFAPKLEKWLEEIRTTPTEAARARLQNYVDSQLEVFIREQVLSLRICDPAMGSGHFLVYIAYTITNFILEVLTTTHWDNAAINLDANYWRRLVVEHCLYGVDINGMAVELAKLSLWLATMQPGRPLSFLDHHLKRGNSLLGARLEDILAALAHSDLTKSTAKSRLAEEKGQYAFRTLPQAVQTIQNANDWLEKITAQVVTRAEDIKTQEYDYEEAQRLLAPYKKIGDLLVARKMGLKVNDNEIALIAKAIETDTVFELSSEYLETLQKAEAKLAGERTVHWELEFSRVFGASNENGGFDIVIGNPPFLGGLKISGELGSHILEFIKTGYSPSVGAADYCVYFFRKGFDILRVDGILGLVSTNSIAQGDTRETGLSVITKQGGLIIYADRYVEWKGEATVEVNLIALTKAITSRNYLKTLDGNVVPNISSYLDDLPDAEIYSLYQNIGKGFQGDIPYGMGFFLPENEALQLINKDPSNLECLLPYLNGQDVNTHPEQKTNRYAICFHDWTLEKASQYPDLIRIVEMRVKPQRDKIKRERNKKRWWLYGEYRKGMREALKPLNNVLVRSMVSELHMISFVPINQILSCKLAVFAYDDYYHFSILQSCVHDVWLRRNATTLRTDISYSISKCFDTFTMPQSPQDQLIIHSERAGQAFYEHRQQVMRARQLGLTKLYNLFNNPVCQDADIIEMRRLHAAMGESVLVCYGWQDIDLRHDFYPNDRKKIRFTPSPVAQREIFTRLMALNQQIAAQESAEGLTPKIDTGDEDELALDAA